VVAAAPPDVSRADRSLLGMEIALTVSRATLAADLAAAGFAPGQITLRRDPGDALAYALAEVEGYVADADPRLAALTAARHPPIVLGAFAIPEAGTSP
jgi:hypothetical protein